LGCGGKAEESLPNTNRLKTMWLKKNNHAQNIIEYAIVVSIISAGIFAMSTYVFRSVQGTQKAITEEFAKD